MNVTHLEWCLYCFGDSWIGSKLCKYLCDWTVFAVSESDVVAIAWLFSHEIVLKTSRYLSTR